MYDANLILQTLVTKTTAFASDAVDLKVGTPRRGLKARLIVPTASCSATGAVVTPEVQHSDDGTAWSTLTRFEPITLTTVAQSVQDFRTVETIKPKIRMNMAFSVTTGSPTITYQADLGISRP